MTSVVPRKNLVVHVHTNRATLDTLEHSTEHMMVTICLIVISMSGQKSGYGDPVSGCGLEFCPRCPRFLIPKLDNYGLCPAPTECGSDAGCTSYYIILKKQ